jgi:hypothetical protein
VLALAEGGDGFGVPRVADEVKAPEALHRHDFAREHGLHRLAHRVARQGIALGVRERQRRAADRAGDRLRVEAPVERVFVFGAAVRAHREGRHRRLRAVVGEVPRDREARPAVRAVCKRIAPAPVLRIEHFLEARLAHRRVGRDGRPDVPALGRRVDAEGGFARIGRLVRLDAVDARERRLFL